MIEKLGRGSVSDKPLANATRPKTVAAMASLQMAGEVEHSLRQQQVGIFFVKPRIVRRVLQNELEIASPWQPPPHRKCCAISRDRLLWLVARDELGVDQSTKLPDQLILIAQPEEERLVSMTREELLRRYWRLMFHARIDAEMLSRTSPDQMTVGELRHRINQIGQTAFDEIRSVLRAEQILTRPDDDRNVYAEFVAVFHELRAFAPQLVSLYFPSLASDSEVLKVIGDECDANKLLQSTRPKEFEPDELSAPVSTIESSPAILVKRIVVSGRSPRKYARLTRLAEWQSRHGNNVRAAITLQSALDAAPAESLVAAQELYSSEIRKLVERLQAALELTDDEARPWFSMCEQLLPNARNGFWNANARLLYDLQNVCLDNEQETYKVDLLRWTLSMGKSPLKRPLSNQRVVRMSKHLRGARGRVASVQIDKEGRRQLERLLSQAAEAAEEILRHRLAPLIAAVLLEAGFVPASVVDRVAFKKMVHELEDEVVDRGFLTLGSLRDCVSRNQLKMTDLKNFDEFLWGDPLLRADILMAATLDGVYSRGPFYLRWLQKANSLAYGLPYGRMFTRFFALPFGLSFLILKTVDVALEHLPIPALHGHVEEEHLAGSVPFVTDAVDVSHEIAAASEAHTASHAHQHVDLLYSHKAMILLGLIIFALMHFPGFRRRVVGFLKSSWTILRFIAFDIPRAVFRWKPIEWLLKSFPMMLFRRFMLGPVIATAVFWLLLPFLGFYDELNRWWGLAIFLTSFLILNSRLGRDTEELAREFFARTWYRIRVHLMLGLFTLIVDVFKALMDGLERVLYAVDEWLRFRSGESNLTLGIKAVVGLIWSVIHGVIRFCVTLLIEPQINPIKHFPVVTVSHKLVITTLTFPIASLLQRFFDKPTAYTVTAIVLTSIPGVFGFLAWELKENWKLYKANRSPKLKPVLIGDHGETLHRLLCPGLHSGTIPRLFAYRRRAARRDAKTTKTNKQAKYVARLHHESTAVQHFFERELLALLKESRTFRDLNLVVSKVDMATNRVLVSIQDEAVPDQPLKIEVAEQSGWLVAVTREPGWLDRLEPEEIDVFKAALTGVYKYGAVDLVREQIERHLKTAPKNGEPRTEGRSVHPYDVADSGLLIWPKGVYETTVYYPLDEQPITHPRPRSIARTYDLNSLPITDLVFADSEVNWEQWRTFWDNEQSLPAHSTARFPFQW